MRCIVRVAAGAAPPVQPKMSGHKLLVELSVGILSFLVIRGTYRRLSVVFVKFSRAG